MDKNNESLSLSEASRLTGFARSTLRKLVLSGALESEVREVPWGGKFRKEYRILRSSLEPHIRNPDKLSLVSAENSTGLEKRLEKIEKEIEEIKQKCRQCEIIDKSK